MDTDVMGEVLSFWILYWLLQLCLSWIRVMALSIARERVRDSAGLENQTAIVSFSGGCGTKRCCTPSFRCKAKYPRADAIQINPPIYQSRRGLRLSRI